ncbi:MAG: hypothetical protein WCJ66_09800 [Verrucomicrobiota bacterium]
MAKNERVYDYRRANLKRVVDNFGGPSKVAEILGYKNASFLVHMIGPSPTRVVSDKSARRFEVELGLDWESLDQETEVLDDLTKVTEQHKARQALYRTIRQQLKNLEGDESPEAQKQRVELDVKRRLIARTFSTNRFAAEPTELTTEFITDELNSTQHHPAQELRDLEQRLVRNEVAMDIGSRVIANTPESKRPAFAWVGDLARANKAKQPSILEDLQLIEIRLPEWADDIKAQIRAKASEIRQILAPPTARPAELAGSTWASVTATGTLTTQPVAPAALAGLSDEQIQKIMADPRAQELLAEIKQLK